MYLPQPPRFYKKIPVLLALLAGLALWQVLVWVAPWPSYLFPSLWEVASAFAALAKTGFLLNGFITTATRLLVGFAISFLLGGALAVLVLRWPTLRRAFTPFMLGVQSLPGVAWVPLGILWLGYSEAALIFVTVMGSVFSITLAFADAVLAVPFLYYKAARNLGLETKGLIFRVGIPAALPQIISGTKQGWSFAWRSLIGAEIVFATVGLGFLLNQGREFLDIAQVVAMMAMILTLGIAMERWVFSAAEDRVRRKWGLSAA